jgi:hypothetical protein
VIDPDELAYPVLSLAFDSSVSVATSSTELCRCNALAWFRHRYFDDLRLFDATATPYQVRSAELGTPLRGWRRLLARVANRQLTVILALERVGPSSLDHARATVIEWLRRAPEFWEEARDLDEWERLVAEGPSIEALCAMFS